MMGDYCIYCDSVLFGLICDNNLYIKQTDAGEAVLDEIELRPPYPSARAHFYITNVDDRDYLTTFIKATIPADYFPRNSFGVIPVTFLKSRVKWLGYSKPIMWAVSLIL